MDCQAAAVIIIGCHWWCCIYQYGCWVVRILLIGVTIRHITVSALALGVRDFARADGMISNEKRLNNQTINLLYFFYLFLGLKQT
jgi:hypothetical protein